MSFHEAKLISSDAEFLKPTGRYFRSQTVSCAERHSVLISVCNLERKRRTPSIASVGLSGQNVLLKLSEPFTFEIKVAEKIMRKGDIS